MKQKFTVLDEIVKTTLESVGKYQKAQNSLPTAVNGGIAAQIYTNQYSSELLRPTHDLDFLYMPKLSFTDFKERIIEPIVKDLPYEKKISSLRHVYEVLMNDPDGDNFLIHTYKWTEKGYENRKKDLQRQISDANLIAVPNSSETIKIVRPEEIVHDKMNRLHNIQRSKNGLPENFLNIYRQMKAGEWMAGTSKNPHEWFEELKRQKMRLPSQYDRGEDEFRQALQEYTSSKDMFDIALLGTLTMIRKLDFDEKYYRDIPQQD